MKVLIQKENNRFSEGEGDRLSVVCRLMLVLV
jgi:hypothetical protein